MLEHKTDGEWRCYGCTTVHGTPHVTPKVVKTSDQPSTAENRYPPFKYLCPDCLMRAVRGGDIILIQGDRKLDPGSVYWETADYSCEYDDRYPDCRSSAYAFPDLRNLANPGNGHQLFVCANCLWYMVVNGDLTIELSGKSTAVGELFPTPTVTEDGSVSVDGMTFRW